jgi:DNA polymerase-3 subunit delta'
LANAYLLHGPEGVGKALFARELTKALFCQEKGTDACNLCNPCKKVASGIHPDFHWVTPLEGKRSIGIGQIQELETRAYLKPLEATHRVFVLEEADKMTEEAFNCLLKTLEEPPPGTLFILTTVSLLSLPRTIRSRCQTVRFHPLSTEVIKGILSERGDLEGGKRLAALSCGSLGRATRLMEERVAPHRNRFLEMLNNLGQEDSFSISQELLEWYPKTLELETRRSLLRTWLDLLLAYYRDILLCKVMAGESPAGGDRPTSTELELFYVELAPFFETRARNLSTDTLLAILEEIITATEGLYSNANLNLLLDNLFLRLADYEGRFKVQAPYRSGTEQG